MLTKEEILQRTDNGLEVFKHYLNINIKPKKLFKNPLYEDKNASCNIYYNKGVYHIKDFGNPTFTGDCFFLVGYLNGLDCHRKEDFRKILAIISHDMGLGLDTPSPISIQKSPMKTPIPPLTEDKQEVPKKYSYQKQSFTQKELSFWQQYGITEGLLSKYKVCSLQSFSSFSREGKPYTLVSGDEEPIFGYEGSNYLKIYRPFSKLRFLYGGKIDHYVFGLEQLPVSGDLLFITGGEKDVLSLAAKGFAAICFNSETASIPPATIQTLSYRFRHIVLLFDSDETGKASATRQMQLLAMYNVKALTLPLQGTKKEKDISDYFAMGHTAAELSRLFANLLQQQYKDRLTLLKSCEIVLSVPPVPQCTVISLHRTPLGVQSSLLGITGGEGTGKSHFVSAMIAGTLSTLNKDTFHFEVTPCPEQHIVLCFDTEQSEEQLYKNIQIIITRAGLSAVPPTFKAFCLTKMPRRERMQVIKECLETFYYKYEGIHLVVIDGIADLIGAANNELESIELIEDLYQLANLYHTCILCVLHLTPSGNKLRGHLGSELQRKAVAVISVESSPEGDLSIAKVLKARSGNRALLPEILFKWDTEWGMHRFVAEQKKHPPKKDATHALASLISPLFKQKPIWDIKELCSELQNITNVKEATARKQLRKLQEKNILVMGAHSNELTVGTYLKELLNQE